jgi:predicted TIM-barrel fold metal-dependent hydrolase
MDPPADTHAAYNEAGGDPSGWKLPAWSVDGSLELMKSHDTRTAILSVTAPGATISSGKKASELCRAINQYAASLSAERPSQFGFFAALPPLVDNLAAVLEEVAYSLDVLKADGVTLYTRYGRGNHYLGHPDFKPLWGELDRRGAVVFVHPTHLVDTNLISSALPQPMIDYPHETTRTAVDLIISNTVKEHPHVKIILPHAGGSLPYLATRAAHLTADTGLSGKDAGEFLDEARSFYFDLALSANPWTLPLITAFAKPGHVLYGSDFPYAPTKTIDTHVRLLGEQKMEAELAYSVSRGAALKLFPRFKVDSDAATVEGVNGIGGR